MSPYKNLVCFSLSSVLIQIRSLKCGKAPGPNGLLAEPLLYGTTKLLEHLTSIISSNSNPALCPFFDRKR